MKKMILISLDLKDVLYVSLDITYKFEQSRHEKESFAFEDKTCVKQSSFCQLVQVCCCV